MKKLIILLALFATTSALFGQKLQASVDVDATKIFGTIWDGLATNEAAVSNQTGKAVTFYVYDYADKVYWVPAHKTLAAKGKATKVVASGRHYKIRPDNKEEAEFLVTPGRYYIYNGPGDVDEVVK